jgi:hypothetical protein
MSHSYEVCGKFKKEKCCEIRTFTECNLLFGYHSEAARHFNVDVRYAKKTLI